MRRTGSAWTFTYPAAVAANGSAFTVSNAAAPSGFQVAVLQKQGSFSQAVAGWTAGTYSISFAVAERLNSTPFSIVPDQDFEVLIDSTDVDEYDESDYVPYTDRNSYRTYSTFPLKLTAGSHTITFRGLDSHGGDYSALIDDVSIVSVVSVPPPTTIGDPGFEGTPYRNTVYNSYGTYEYNPTDSPWTFAGKSGATLRGSAFTDDHVSSVEGTNVAFLQAQGSISQTDTDWAAGTYSLSFFASQRAQVYANLPLQHEDFQVLIDDTVIGTFAPAGINYEQFVTTPFTVTAGSHTVTFRGLDTLGGDHTAFIDDLVVTRD